MRWILAWSIQLRLLVLAAAAVLMVFGVTQLRSLPVDVLPEFSRPYVEVQTEAHGLSAAEVAQLRHELEKTDRGRERSVVRR